MNLSFRIFAAAFSILCSLTSSRGTPLGSSPSSRPSRSPSPISKILDIWKDYRESSESESISFLSESPSSGSESSSLGSRSPSPQPQASLIGSSAWKDYKEHQIPYLTSEYKEAQEKCDNALTSLDSITNYFKEELQTYRDIVDSCISYTDETRNPTDDDLRRIDRRHQGILKKLSDTEKAVIIIKERVDKCSESFKDEIKSVNTKSKKQKYLGKAEIAMESAKLKLYEHMISTLFAKKDRLDRKWEVVWRVVTSHINQEAVETCEESQEKRHVTEKKKPAEKKKKAVERLKKSASLSIISCKRYISQCTDIIIKCRRKPLTDKVMRQWEDLQKRLNVIKEEWKVTKNELHKLADDATTVDTLSLINDAEIEIAKLDGVWKYIIEHQKKKDARRHKDGRPLKRSFGEILKAFARLADRILARGIKDEDIHKWEELNEEWKVAKDELAEFIQMLRGIEHLIVHHEDQERLVTLENRLRHAIQEKRQLDMQWQLILSTKGREAVGDAAEADKAKSEKYAA